MIDIKQVHKSFGNREILKGIDLHVPTGSVTVILGPSGSGKTTFLRTLNFLEKADAGTMQLNDIFVDLHKASNKEILNVRRNTSMVFQSYNLFSNKTVIENIMEGLVTVKKMKKPQAREIAQRFLKEVGMEGYDDITIRYNYLGVNNNVSVSLVLLRWTQRLSSLTNLHLLLILNS